MGLNWPIPGNHFQIHRPHGRGDPPCVRFPLFLYNKYLFYRLYHQRESSPRSRYVMSLESAPHLLISLGCSVPMCCKLSGLDDDSSKLLMRSSTRRQVIDSSMNTSLRMLITDQLGELIEWLLPASPGLRVHQLIATSDELTLLMASTHSEACCPLCGQSSARVHSHYTRTLQDLPWAAFQVR